MSPESAAENGTTDRDPMDTTAIASPVPTTSDDRSTSAPSIDPAEDLHWSATLSSSGTDTQPPTIDLQLTNTGTTELQMTFGPTPPFSTPWSEPSEADDELLLYHPDTGPHIAPEQPVEGCW